MSESRGSSKGSSKGIQRANGIEVERDVMKQMKDDSINEWERLEHISTSTLAT